jgi:hypothetical protein
MYFQSAFLQLHCQIFVFLNQQTREYRINPRVYLSDLSCVFIRMKHLRQWYSHSLLHVRSLSYRSTANETRHSFSSVAKQQFKCKFWEGLGENVGLCWRAARWIQGFVVCQGRPLRMKGEVKGVDSLNENTLKN